MNDQVAGERSFADGMSTNNGGSGWNVAQVGVHVYTRNDQDGRDRDRTGPRSPTDLVDPDRTEVRLDCGKGLRQRRRPANAPASTNPQSSRRWARRAGNWPKRAANWRG